MVTTACTGAVATSPGLSSVSIAAVKESSASLGRAPIRVRTAPIPAVAGAPAGADAAATASPAKYAASPLPLLGIASRSDPQAGKSKPDNEFGLVCRPGNAAQFWLARACCNSGRTASNTGDITSERLSLMAWLPAAPVSRAAEMELLGIHNPGWPPSSVGHLPMKPLMTASEPAEVTATATQRSPTGPADAL